MANLLCYKIRPKNRVRTHCPNVCKNKFWNDTYLLAKLRFVAQNIQSLFRFLSLLVVTDIIFSTVCSTFPGRWMDSSFIGLTKIWNLWAEINRSGSSQQIFRLSHIFLLPLSLPDAIAGWYYTFYNTWLKLILTCSCHGMFQHLCQHVSKKSLLINNLFIFYLQVFHRLLSNTNIVIISVYQWWMIGFLKLFFYMFPCCGWEEVSFKPYSI